LKRLNLRRGLFGLDGLIILRYLFGLRGDVFINGVIASDATVILEAEIGERIEVLMPSL
jgi:hypothetical protein